MKKTNPNAQFRAWLKRTGNSYIEAAKVLGVSHFAIHAWKHEMATPTYLNARKIEQVVGISLESWFK